MGKLGQNIFDIIKIRLINCERFNTNDNEYLKLVDGMRGKPLKSLIRQSFLPPRQSAILQVYHGEVGKCASIII
jgi:hypothetical protein